MSALKTIAPKGLVTLSKFSELILGLGIELTDALQEWIIGELVVNSESMEELKYELIEKLWFFVLIDFTLDRFRVSTKYFIFYLLYSDIPELFRFLWPL